VIGLGGWLLAGYWAARAIGMAATAGDRMPSGMPGSDEEDAQ
jgi:hypothetical protein